MSLSWPVNIIKKNLIVQCLSLRELGTGSVLLLNLVACFMVLKG